MQGKEPTENIQIALEILASASLREWERSFLEQRLRLGSTPRLGDIFLPRDWCFHTGPTEARSTPPSSLTGKPERLAPALPLERSLSFCFRLLPYSSAAPLRNWEMSGSQPSPPSLCLGARPLLEAPSRELQWSVYALPRTTTHGPP